MFKNDTYKRLEPIVNAMDKSIICDTLTDNSNGTYTYTTNYTKWATIGHTITIGLLDYKIVDVDVNVSITVSGVSLPTQLTFDLYPFKFMHGTIRKVAEELTAKQFGLDKYPLIVLKEILDERIRLDDIDSIGTDSDCTLFFITDSVFEDWKQSDGDNKGVLPMRSGVNEFIKALSVASNVGELTGVGTAKSYNYFGTQDANGVIRNTFNDFTCGMSLRINIPFLKDCECCDSGNVDTRPAPAYVYDTLGNVLAILYSNEIYISSGGVCLPVLIKDKLTGDTIASVNSGGQYDVTVLREIQDTIDNNEVEIINPI